MTLSVVTPASADVLHYAREEYQRDCERSVIGGVLVFPERLAAIRLQVPGLAVEDFGREAHRHVWAAIEVVEQIGDLVDVLSVKRELQVTGRLEDVGGVGELARFANIPRLSDTLYYACRVRTLAIERAFRLALADAAAAPSLREMRARVQVALDANVPIVGETGPT